MISTSAFARSRPLMARYDVSMHMTKWWKAHRPDDGQVCSFFPFYQQSYFCVCFTSWSEAMRIISSLNASVGSDVVAGGEGGRGIGDVILSRLWVMVMGNCFPY